MGSRVDRQNREVTKSRIQNKASRTEKNYELYENLYSNSNYTGIANITNKAIVEFETLDKKLRSRENYHQIKEYQNLIQTPNNTEKEDLSIFFMEDNKRSYDINDIISDAKQNRINSDEIEQRRRLTNTQYDILSDLKLERNENKEIKEEELQELINTITSKSLKEDISSAKNKELLVELLPTSTNAITVSASKDCLDDTNQTDEQNITDDNIDLDRNFFSQSLEISKKELENNTEFKELEKGSNILFIILITLIIIVITITIAIIVLNNI